ncbi:MAG: discoidin domain-containing protein [archaeon]
MRSRQNRNGHGLLAVLLVFFLAAVIAVHARSAEIMPVTFDDKRPIDVLLNNNDTPIEQDPKIYDYYSPRNVFIVSDNDWKNVLPLVPVTTWTYGSIIHAYPTLLLHDEDNRTLLINYASARNGGSAYAPSSAQGSSPSNVIDENPSTIWNNGRLDNDTITIDLGVVRTVDELRIMQACDLYGYNISISTDNITYVALTSGYFDYGLLQYFVSPQRQARYIAITLNDPIERPNWKCLGDVSVYNNADRVSVRGFDPDSLIQFLQMYEPDRVTIVGDTVQEFDDLLVAPQPLGAGLQEDQLERIYPADLPNYWRPALLTQVILVDNNYARALIASTYASLLNVPLVINVTPPDPRRRRDALDALDTITDPVRVVPSNVKPVTAVTVRPVTAKETVSAPTPPPGNPLDDVFYPNTPAIFTDREVILVGNVNCPATASSCRHMTLAEIQQEYVTRTQTDKVLLVNSRDYSSVDMDQDFFTDKGTYPIHTLFIKHSLAAPFLAGAKQELLVNNPILTGLDDSACNTSPAFLDAISTTDHFMDEVMTTIMDNRGNYLTILSSPKAIPDSKLNFCAGDPLHPERDNTQLRIPLDYQYGVKTFPFIIPTTRLPEYSLYTGRIYGISSTDASSYIARSIFYDDLMDRLYSGSFTSFSIGTFCYSNNPAQRALNTRNYFLEHDYTAICSSNTPQYACDRVSENSDDWFSTEDLQLLNHQQFITFEDHGCTDCWAEVLHTYQTPEMQLPIVISQSCLTSNFWTPNKYGTYTMSHYFLRKGAMGYFGAVGLTYANGITSSFGQRLTQNTRLDSLGMLGYYLFNSWDDTTTIGDPTLIFRKNPTEDFVRECNDGIDNDGDGHIDYEWDCGCTNGPMSISESPGNRPEAQCNDGIDNNGNGLIDTQDRACTIIVCYNNETLPVNNCTDLIDNDNDGGIDFESDPACHVSYTGGVGFNMYTDEGPECDDNIDNDGDGDIDWDGAGLAGADAACVEPYLAHEGPECDDGIDNDGDGDTDWEEDAACFGYATFYFEGPPCDDGIDNDGDGNIDWDGAGQGPPDAACRGQPQGEEFSICDDGIDNDGDGSIDWDGKDGTTPDVGCRNALSTKEDPQCSDGIDNDDDDDIDYEGRSADPACIHPYDDLEGTPCDNSIDDDDDGDIDWDGVYRTLDPYAPDPGCNGDPNGIEWTQCDDNIDNDEDEGVDWDGVNGQFPVDTSCTHPWDSETGWPSGGDG